MRDPLEDFVRSFTWLEVLGTSSATAFLKIGLDMEMKPNTWLAAQVKASREFSVSSALQGKGYETFVPAYASFRKWSDRQKMCTLPLIQGYVFVKAILEKAQSPIISTPGVLRMVAFGGHIASIDDSELGTMRKVVNSSLKAEPWSYIKQHSKVRIVQGSLAGIQGTVLQIKEKTLLVISIELLQRSVAVRIDQSWVEPAQG